jgi:octaprenyl-diphosphate synthase
VIAEGEVLQLTAASNLATSEATYLQVIRGKTAALFAAATEVGGVIAGAPQAQVRALFAYGDALGIAFQIADDLLDYGGLSATLGKNTGDDFRERKMTLPVIRAVDSADGAEREFWARVIGKGDQREGDLEQAQALMRRHGALESTHCTAADHAARAREALAPLPDGPLKDDLVELTEFIVARVA